MLMNIRFSMTDRTVVLKRFDSEESVELNGIEPSTSGLQSPRSPS